MWLSTFQQIIPRLKKMNKLEGCAGPVLAMLPGADRGCKVSQLQNHCTKDSKAANYLNTKTNPHRPQHYLLTINEGDRVWAYPLTWTKAELLALLLMTGQQIRALNLSFTPKDPPRDVERLHELIKGLFPSMARVAAMASARAEEVAA